MQYVSSSQYAFKVLAAILAISIPSTAMDFTWTLGDAVNQSQFNGLECTGSLIWEGDDLWFLYPGSNNTTYRWKGTSMDDLVRQPNGNRDGSFTQPYGDDGYWISHVWRDPDDGKWYALTHVEFHYPPGNKWASPAFRRVGYSTSSDFGANWHYEGDLLTSDNPLTREEFSGNYWDNGEGDMKLYVDNEGGYFYVWFLHDWCSKDVSAGWERYQSMRVARSPIADKMAPGTWMKWYNGSWSEPGLGGHASDVFVNADNAHVFYNTYLERYVAIGIGMDDFLATCTDLSLQDWTPMQRMRTGYSLGYYNFAVDPATWTRGTTGQDFRLYCSRMNQESFPTKYYNFSFGEGTTQPRTWQPDYPPESVPDHNPGWDWDYAVPAKPPLRRSPRPPDHGNLHPGSVYTVTGAAVTLPQNRFSLSPGVYISAASGRFVTMR